MKNKPNPFRISNSHSNGLKGFTLVELLVVITIIAVLAALVLTVTGKIKARAYQANAMSSLRQVAAFSAACRKRSGWRTLSTYKAMTRVAGVKTVSVDFDAKRAVVDFDSSRTTVAAIGTAPTRIAFDARGLRRCRIPGLGVSGGGSITAYTSLSANASKGATTASLGAATASRDI